MPSQPGVSITSLLHTRQQGNTVTTAPFSQVRFDANQPQQMQPNQPFSLTGQYDNQAVRLTGFWADTNNNGTYDQGDTIRVLYGNGNLTGPMTMYQYQHGQTHPHTSTVIETEVTNNPPSTVESVPAPSNAEDTQTRQATINTLQHRYRLLVNRLNNGEAEQPALFPRVLPNNFTPTFDPDGNGTIDAYRYDRQARRFIRLAITDLNQIVTSPDGSFRLANNPNEFVFVPQVFQNPVQTNGITLQSGQNMLHDVGVVDLPNGLTFSDIQGPNDAPLYNQISSHEPTQISRQSDLEAYWGGIGHNSNSGIVGHSGRRFYHDNPEAAQNWVAQARANPSSYVYMVSGNLLNLTVEQALRITVHQLNQLGAPLPGSTQP
ncbi:MAG: hypothetical protein KC476_11585 [Cyanobacteria bacterium HKST-UBA06]|nr:hypothetical protein [Cyanobacteria bacterium HKST-UBA04]MCA9808585.1 hypothetical protein [Cyanobacteria bacterium HKST-UBA06]